MKVDKRKYNMSTSGVLMSESTVSITQMRNHFDEYLQCVKSGEVFIITRYGKAFARFTPAPETPKEQKSTLSQSKENAA